jgi:hypothetical protein
LLGYGWMGVRKQGKRGAKNRRKPRGKLIGRGVDVWVGLCRGCQTSFA